MGNLNTLVLTAADYSTILSIPTNAGIKRFVLQTNSELSYDISVEGEYVYVIGSDEPAANKTNAKAYKGSWSIQSGEFNAILQRCGFQSGVDIQGATLSIAALVGAFAKVFRDVNVLSDSGSITAKAKETLNKLSFQAIGLG